MGLLASLILTASCATPPTAPADPVLQLSPAASPSASYAAAMPAVAAPDFLADGFAATTKRRALLLNRSSLRYSESGDTLGDTEPPTPLVRPKEVVVLDEAKGSLRILVEIPDVRLLLYADRSAFAEVSCAQTRLALGADVPPDEAAGVHVAPGVVLVEKARSGTRVLVEGSAAKVSFEGWVTPDSLCMVYEPQPFAPAAGAGRLREGTVVRASPSGPIVATFDGQRSGQRSFSFIVEPEPGAPIGWQRIGYRAAQLELRGVVTATDFQAIKGGVRLGGEHKSRVTKGILSDSKRGVLAVGASLYAPEDRSRVGKVLEPLGVYYGLGPPEPGGLVKVELFAGELGLISALALASDIGPEPPP